MDLRQYAEADDSEIESEANKQMRRQIAQEYRAFKESVLFQGLIDAAADEMEPLMDILVMGGDDKLMATTRTRIQGLRFIRDYFDDIGRSIQASPEAYTGFEDVDGEAIQDDELTTVAS